MKRKLTAVFILSLTLSIAGCGESAYRMGISIPEENTPDILWSDEEISPKGGKITVTSSNEFDDVELELKPVEAKDENAYEPVTIAPGRSVTMNVEKGAWFKVGIHMKNAVPGKVKYLEIKGVTVRISSQVEPAEGGERPAIGLDGVTYYSTGRAVPVEPDESAVEYVEIPAGGGTDGMITAYARLEEGGLLVCRIDGEWYEFQAEICDGVPLAPEGFSKP